MKKILLFGMCASVLFTFTACHTSQSAYKKAYEKAKQQEQVQQKTTPVTDNTTAPVVVERQETPTTAPANVRQEKVSVVSGNELKDFNVVAGSFGKKENADNLKNFLIKEGYQESAVAFNAEKGTYRVIVSTYADYNSAAQARDSFKAKYPGNKDFQGAWLLYRVK